MYIKVAFSALIIATVFSGCFGWGQLKPKHRGAVDLITPVEFKA